MLYNKIIHIIIENQVMPEEIRIKLGQAPIIRCLNLEYICSNILISQKDITYIMMNATDGAFHASIDAMRNGYLPLPNGCRLGICGKGAVREERIHSIYQISSLCLRIAAERKGCADEVVSMYQNNRFQNTIIISPPGIGKTTLLRECIRVLSNEGYYIGVADERGEISGMHKGNPSFDLGPRTDVIFGIKKQKAASMLLRTMSPNILAMDEITSHNDLPAIIEAVGCGVSLLTTVHGEAVSDLEKPAMKEITSRKVFQKAVVISIEGNQRVYRVIDLYV